MKIMRSTDERGRAYLERAEARFGEVFSEAFEERVRHVVSAVRRRGDRALATYVKRFDLAGLKVADFRLQGHVGAGEDVDQAFVAAVEVAIANITRFHEAQAVKGYTLDHEGTEMGIRVRPLESVGVYVPGGAAVYISSLLMAVVPARIAGVPRIAVATPPRAFLSSRELRYVLDRLDLREVYLMGGAHAVAALVFGTASVAPVDKIVGPGGRWVAAAKRAVAGQVAVDLIAGPSELVVIADAHAEPEIVAADMLAQAEHDPDALVALATPSRALAEAVEKRLAAATKRLPKGAAARESLRRWGAILLTSDLAGAVEVANRIAPEHVELLVDEPHRWVDGVERAGAIYLGSWSPAVLGDYVVGSNHVLPTAGAARFASPLGVWDFVNRTAVVRVAAHRYAALARPAATLAGIEALPLHAAALAAGSRGKM
jgi:histidinol dehydrogenase